MTDNAPREPERPPQDYRRRYPRNEKEEEKRSEKDEKERTEKAWDEKWRRDPMNAISWAAIFVWAGIVLLAETTGWGPDTFRWWSTWAVIMAGAGAIFVLGALIRMLLPEHRRPVTGNMVLGLVLLGVGLGELNRWKATPIAVILILIGVLIILTGAFRRRR